MSDLFSTNWVLLLCSAIILVIAVVQWRQYQYNKAQIERLNQEIGKLKNTLNALISSAVGVDRRMNQLELVKIELQQRQESMEQQNRSDRPYAEAIHRAQKGATATDLMEEFGMSSNEADLIVMLHRSNSNTA
jgi:biopolymer transport protein ExbB/TolQ